MSFLQGKTPISFLQELCTKKGITPQYDLIANEGAVHEPTFVFKVMAGDFIGTGKGSSKKKAKHNAALNILTQMMGVGDEDTKALKESGNPEQLLPTADDPDPDGNPVGELQEMTQKRLWTPPVYEYTEEDGSANGRDFVCTVKVSTYSEVGHANSKKAAKRKAAYMMVQVLKRTLHMPQELNRPDLSEDRQILPLPKDDPPVAVNAHHQQAPRAMSENERFLVTEFFSSAIDSKVPLADVGYIEMLTRLSKKFTFEVTYTDFGTHTETDNKCIYLYIVELKFKKEKTPIVCPGMGSTVEEAKTDAASSALKHLAVVKQGAWV